MCRTCAAQQPWTEAPPFFFKSLTKYVLVFVSKQTNVIKDVKKKSILMTLTCNNRPFSFPLYIPMTSAALTMRHPAALRALAPRHGQIRATRLFHLVIFKDDIHSLSAFCYCLHRDAPPCPLPLFSPSCDSLMKRSPLNWKTVIKMRWVLFTSVHGGWWGGGTSSTELVNQKLII